MEEDLVFFLIQENCNSAFKGPDESGYFMQLFHVFRVNLSLFFQPYK